MIQWRLSSTAIPETPKISQTLAGSRPGRGGGGLQGETPRRDNNRKYNNFPITGCHVSTITFTPQWASTDKLTRRDNLIYYLSPALQIRNAAKQSRCRRDAEEMHLSHDILSSPGCWTCPQGSPAGSSHMFTSGRTRCSSSEKKMWLTYILLSYVDVCVHHVSQGERQRYVMKQDFVLVCGMRPGARRAPTPNADAH